MRLFTANVFSGWVVGDANMLIPTYSLPQFENILGCSETLALEVTISDTTGSPSDMRVDTQWSNTGAVWVNRQSTVVHSSSGSAGTYFGVEASTTTGGHFARLAIFLKNGTANVRVIVCGRAQQSWL